MATFQTSANTALPNQLTLIVDNVLKFKVIPARGELVPFTLSITPSTSLTLVDQDVRTGANFQIYTVKAARVGTAQFSAQNAKGVKVGPVSVTIKAAIKLPTSGGALALTQLLLAESPSPYAVGYNATTAKTGMHWMRRVIQNRLDMKSLSVGSAGAKSIIDVMKAEGQFKGFEDYPTIAKAQRDTIEDILAIANDGTHPKQKLFYDHVNAAIAVPTESLIVDPAATKDPGTTKLLVSWRTAGASSPGSGFKLFRTFAGQDFYTLA